MEVKSLGSRIAQRLEELGKSQHWLAEAVGIKQPSVNAIIHTAGSGSKHVVAIAEALGVAPKWLADGTGPKLPRRRVEALLVGKVGAGAEITRFDEGTVLEGIEPPPGPWHLQRRHHPWRFPISAAGRLADLLWPRTCRHCRRLYRQTVGGAGEGRPHPAENPQARAPQGPVPAGKLERPAARRCRHGMGRQGSGYKTAIGAVPGKV